jgi:hypothetical protein
MPDHDERGTVERTESHVQCECPPALCRHQPDGYRVVVEWGAWDERGNFLGTFDTKREAHAVLVEAIR